MPNNKEKLAKDMLWNIVGNLFYCLCQWIMTVLIVRLTSYKEAGYLSLAMSTSSTFSAISHFSMRNFQVSDVKEEFSSNEYIGSRIVTCLIALLLCCTYAINSSDTYQMLCIDAFMIIRIIEGIVDVLHGVNQKHSDYKLIGISCLIRGFSTLFGFITGLLIFKSTLIAIVLTAICNLFVVIFYDYRKTSQYENIKPIIWNNHIKQLLLKCLPLVICTFLLSAIPLVAKTSLQKQLGTELLGIYSSISSPTIVVQIVASYAFSPLLPHISDSFNMKRYDTLIKMIEKLICLFIVFAIVILLGGSLIGKFGLSILYGKDILEYYELFIPIVMCTIMTAFVYVFMSIITAFRMQVPMMIGISFNFFLSYLLKDTIIKNNGANGVSYLHIGSYILILVWLVTLAIYRCKKEN